MARFRQLSPWYWIVLGALLLLGVVSVANLVLGWEQTWIIVATPLVGIGTSIFTFRLLWKQWDHPSFHPDDPQSGVTKTGQ